MPQSTFVNPWKAFAVWGAALTAGAVLAVLGTAALDRHAARLSREHPWPYLRAADRLKAQHDWPEALRQLELAAKFDPGSPLPHERAGLLYYERKRWSESLEAYRHALDLGSPEPDIRGKVIWCLIHLGRNEEAAQFGEASINEGFSSPNFHRYIADAYRRAGNPAKAVPFYEAALEQRPNDLHLMERLAQECRRAGYTEKAQAMERRINEAEERYEGLE